jgi:adenine-specific DNA-methyltransferase
MKLDQAYDRLSFQEFLGDFLPGYTKDTRKVDSTSNLFDSAVQLGSSAELDLLVFEISLDASIEKRIAITTDAFKLMKQYQAYRALIVFRTGNGDRWRLSLMTSTPTIVDGKVITKLSNPRRFSYLLGQDAKIVTPYKYLIDSGPTKDFNDLQKRFSAEVVNNDFYREIAKLYDALVGVDGISRTLVCPGDDEAAHQFAVRLIGRTVFCWFLREKKSDRDKPLIGKDLLSYEAAKKNNYYNDTLVPMFFEVLNKPINKRIERFQEGAFGAIPYLNGGLFSPLPEDYYKLDRETGSIIPGVVHVPDEWIKAFFELLDTYHFTVDENTSVDVDLSIDPEMLGRIFENLLARINPETGETVRKNTGSFYTPREIVEYMVDESLIQYIKLKTGVEVDKIKALVSYDLNDDSKHPLTNSEKVSVINSLGSVKILDPACGSGAFPIGILQKIVYILQRIDPEAKQWFDSQVADTPPELRHLIETEFKHKNFDYIRKLGVIRESIFGVDIQPIATEIARLRCFLTLIVDERVSDAEPNRGIYPLPNLDFKFVTANTLMKLNIPATVSEDQTGLFEDVSGIDELSSLRDEYFNSQSIERDSLKLQFSQAQNRMLQNMIANHRHGYSDVTQKLSTWDPFSHKGTGWFDINWMFGIEDGFDIVIGNPPYYTLAKGKGQKSDQSTISQYKDLYETFEYKGNTFALFYEKGIEILNKTGIISYITPDTLLLNNSFSKLRKILIENVEIQSILNVKDKIFGDAEIGGASVIIATRDNDRNDEVKIDICNDSKLRYVNTKYVPRKLLSSAPGGRFILDKEQLEILSMMVNFGKRLDTVASFYNGIKTGDNKKYLSEDDKGGAYKPAIRGRDFNQYESPLSQLYVLYDKEKLWSNTNEEKLTSVPRLLVRQTADRIIATYEEVASGLPMDTVHILYDMKCNPYFLLGLLNSKLATWFYRALTNEEGRVFAEIKIVHLKSLPILFNDKLEQEIAELAKNAMNIKDKEVIEREIDSKIYELYALDEEAISIVEDSL